MPLPSGDRALRRLVADLAMAPRDDIDAVLDELEPKHRLTVQFLVAEMLGPDPGAAAREDEEMAAVAKRLGLSPWVAAVLVDGAAAHGGPLSGASPGVGGAPAGASPTSAAMAALRACVAELAQEPVGASPAMSKRRWMLLWSAAARRSGGR